VAVVPALPPITGGVVTTSEQAAIVAVVAFLLKPPTAVLRQTVAQSIPNNAFTAVTLDTRDQDSAGGWSSGSNTRYTAQYAGWYECSGSAGFAANATGSRAAAWSVNGTLVNQAGQFVGTNAGGVGVNLDVPTQLLFLNVSDFVEFRIFQSSGAALLTVVTANNQSGVSIKFVSQ
jgi:hypothetical protein